MKEVSQQLPREKVGSYRLIRLLGKGGMGAVYEAIQEPIERRVAIKILHGRYAHEPEIAARFFNEARAVNIVDHPGIVQISDYGHGEDGVAFLVMEYLRGENLTQRLKRGQGKLSQAEAMRIARQVASALTAAHEKGIVHRDLKPDNIMLTVDPDPEAMGRVRAKLLDFGIAKVAREVGSSSTNTADDVVMGTPKYMSPEQCRGAANVDDRSDVYSLGVIMYEMLVGQPPFLGPTGEILAKQIYEEPPLLHEQAPWVTAEASALVHRCLIKDKLERPTMVQVLRLLEGMTALYPTMAHAVVAPPLFPQGEDAQTTPIERVEDITNPRLSAAPSQPGERDTGSGMQKNSTLGYSVGHSVSFRTGKRWKRRLAIVSAALVVSGAVGVAILLRTPTSSVPQNSGQRPISAPPKKVFWSVTSTPAGAEVTRISDGMLLGKTPWHGEEVEGGEDVPLRLSMAGHKDHVVHLRRVGNDSADVKMELLPPEVPDPIQPPPSPKPVRKWWQLRTPTQPAQTKPIKPNDKPKLVD